VKRRVPIHAQYLVGADGHNSTTRQKLGIQFERESELEAFAAYEFEAETAGEDEVRVVFDQGTTNVLWPLGENRFRWTFQLIRTETGAEFPEKDRRAVRLEQPIIDERVRQCVEKVAQHRAPWFKTIIKRITWCTEVAFQHRVVSSFGRNRCWLAGDAAHQTGPVGVQSMNAGFQEAGQLGEALRQILQENAEEGLLEGYNRDGQVRWRKLLGMTGGLKIGSNASTWVQEHYDRFLPCLPALDEGLEALTGQLNLTFPPNDSVASGLLSHQKAV
jgi:2-polyprenyl-6-methoxyphenol hydroxylase-like FAD-dependent oxidoreductase